MGKIITSGPFFIKRYYKQGSPLFIQNGQSGTGKLVGVEGRFVVMEVRPPIQHAAVLIVRCELDSLVSVDNFSLDEYIERYLRVLINIFMFSKI